MIAFSSMCFLRLFKLSNLILISNPQSVVYEPFIDYETGEIKEGSHYFKPLSKTITQYVDHPESKFDGDIGILERKHMYADGVIYKGKEANNIEEQALDVKKPKEFIDEDGIKEKILALTPEEARKLGIKHRSALAYLKKKAKEGDFNFKTKNVKRLVEKLGT